MAQWFYVLANSAGTQYVLNAASENWITTQQSNTNWLESNTSYGVTTVGQNQLWRLTVDGYLENQQTGMVLGAASGSTSAGMGLVNASPGDATQKWTFVAAQPVRFELDNPQYLPGYLYNEGLRLYLTSAWLGNNCGIGMSSMSDGAVMQWRLVPASPPIGQMFALDAVSTAGQGTSALTAGIAGVPGKAGTQVALVSRSSKLAAAALWKYTVEGFICSTLNPELVLSLDLNNPRGGGYGIAVLPKQPTVNGVAPLFQLWGTYPVTTQRPGTWVLTNCLNNQALTLPSSPSEGALLLTAPVDLQDNTQWWFTSPDYFLDVLLNQPSAPFTVFSGQELTVYNSLNTSLGLPSGADLRQQYANLAAPLAAYQATLGFAAQQGAAEAEKAIKAAVGGSPYTGPSPANWGAVALELNRELLDVQSVQAFFQQVTMFHTQLSGVMSDAVAKLAADVLIDDQAQTAKTSFSLGALFEGLIYTALSAASSFTGMGWIGQVFPVVANLYQTGLNTAGAYAQSRASNAQQAARAQQELIWQSYEGSLSELQQFLIQSFEVVGGALASLEGAILSDSIKTRVVAAATRQGGSASSLYWPVNQSPLLVERFLPGFELAIMQILMPAMYQIYRMGWVQDAGPSSYYQWSEKLPGSCDKIGSYYDQYWVARISNKDTTPSQATMENDVWGNNALPEDFYLRQGAWKGLQVCETWLAQGGGAEKYVLVQFINYSQNTLSVKLVLTDENWGFGTQGSGGTLVLTLPPYEASSMVLQSGTPHNPSADVTITLQSNGAQVYSGTATANQCSDNTWQNGYCGFPSNQPATFTNKPSLWGAGGCTIGLYSPTVLPTMAASTND